LSGFASSNIVVVHNIRVMLVYRAPIFREVEALIVAVKDDFTGCLCKRRAWNNFFKKTWF